LCLVVYRLAFGVTFGMASFALSVLHRLAAVFAVLALGFTLRRAKVPSSPGQSPTLFCRARVVVRG
jgi:hypothetical protein